MIEIPEQLRREVLRFIRLPKGKKYPPPMNWTKDEKQRLRYYDPIILEHLKNDGNYGVCCGIGNLTVIDADNEKFQKLLEEKLPKTFTVLTPHRKGKHFYYFCTLSKPIIFDVGEQHFGEARSFGQYVVGPNSMIEWGRYEVIDDLIDIEG